MDPPGGEESLLRAVDEVLAGAGAEAADPLYVHVRTSLDVARLAEEVLGEREGLLVGLTERLGAPEPVLRLADVRAVVGPNVPVHHVRDRALLRELAELVGPRLKLDAGSLRLWWPGACVRSEASGHPTVVGLDDEDYIHTREHLAREYHLSHPLVREHLCETEDARALLDHEIARVQDYNQRIHQRLRDAQIDCHLQSARAEAAEARAASLEHAAACACWAVPVRVRGGGSQPE